MASPISNALQDGAREGTRIESWLDRWWPWVWSALIVIVSLGAAGKSADRLLWHDELFTLHGARLDPGALWMALEDGFDLQPPLGYLLTKLSVRLFGDGLVQARLPAILGFATGLATIGLFVRRAAGTRAGTIALLVPAVTLAYDYSFEARPYGAVFGAAGASLLAWQSVAGRRRRWLALTALAASLGAAVSLHYYAVLLVVPIGVGQLVRSRLDGRFDRAPWLAMVAGCLPLVAFLPLMHAASTFGDMFWTRASLGQIGFTYRRFLYPTLLPLALFVAGCAAARLLWPRTVDVASPSQDARPELAVLTVLLVLPLVAIATGFVVGGYRDRYALAGLLGFAGVVALLVERAPRMARVLAGVLVVWVVARSVMHAQPLVSPRSLDVLERHRLLHLTSAAPSVPILIANDAIYTQLRHYGPADLASRLHYVVPLTDGVVARRQDTSERTMHALARWWSMSILAFGDVRQFEPPFFVYGDGEWLTAQLQHEGATLEYLGESYGQRLLRVTFPDGPRP